MSHILEIQKEPSTWSALFKPSVLELLAYFDKFEHLDFTRFHYVEMTDELEVKGTYKDYAIEIYMEYGGAINLTAKSEMPSEIFQELETYFKNYKSVSREELKLATERFHLLAKGQANK